MHTHFLVPIYHVACFYVGRGNLDDELTYWLFFLGCCQWHKWCDIFWSCSWYNRATWLPQELCVTAGVGWLGRHLVALQVTPLSSCHIWLNLWSHFCMPLPMTACLAICQVVSSGMSVIPVGDSWNSQWCVGSCHEYLQWVLLVMWALDVTFVTCSYIHFQSFGTCYLHALWPVDFIKIKLLFFLSVLFYRIESV